MLETAPSAIGLSSRWFFRLFEEVNFKSLSEIVSPCVKRCCKEEAEPKGGHMFRAKEGLDSQLENACGRHS